MNNITFTSTDTNLDLSRRTIQRHQGTINSKEVLTFAEDSTGGVRRLYCFSYCSQGVKDIIVINGNLKREIFMNMHQQGMQSVTNGDVIQSNT